MPPEVAYWTVTSWLLATDSDTVNTTASPSVALASDTASAGMITGPATTLDSECDSGRSSEVQIASTALQSVVSGSRIVTASWPSGSTVMFHAWLLPCCWRWAVFTSPPVTVNAVSRRVT